MSYNGSGSFSINTSGQPVTSGTSISSTVFNAFTADIATGLTTAICKDGQTTITADLPMNNHKFTGMANGSAATDSATIANLQAGTGIYVGTVGGTADAITLTPSPAISAYAAGQTFSFLASGANTGAVTVAVSGLSAKAVKKNGTTSLVANDILSGTMIELEYDGTNFQLRGLGQSIIGTLSTATSDITTLQTNSLSKTLADAKGDLFVATADNTVARKAVGTNGYLLAADSAQSDGLNWVAPASAISATGLLLNATFTVTMAANAVTIALKTAAGTDPSASDPVSVVFRHGTATTGTYLTRTITGALSTVISSGSTGGTLNNTPSRIYVAFLDNAGTVELCWWNPLNTTGLYAVTENQLVSTTAEGGAGGADSAHVIYSSTARSNVYLRHLGYFESTQVTAGTWAAAATKLQLIGPGVATTGDIVQVRVSASGAVATGSTTTPSDDTIPQVTEGDEYMSLTLTPTSSLNLLMVEHTGIYSNSSGVEHTIALFQDGASNAIASSIFTIGTVPGTFTLDHLKSAGTASATTFSIRVGPTAGTTTFNGSGGTRRHGGVCSSRLVVTELMV